MSEHKKILLAGNQENNLVFCEGCEIAELTIGRVSVLLSEKALHEVYTILHEGMMKRSVLKATSVSDDFDYESLSLH